MTWYPAAASAGIWWRHEWASSGKPWASTTTGLPGSPASVTRNVTPLVSTNRVVGVITISAKHTGSAWASKSGGELLIVGQAVALSFPTALIGRTGPAAPVQAGDIDEP